jgi:hypothetical protein
MGGKVWMNEKKNKKKVGFDEMETNFLKKI